MRSTPPASPIAPTGRRWHPGWIAFALLVLVLTWLGYREFWFLCDDAFITFRYVEQARAGHGLVWNPGPFLPVEGYTCFVWALLLWACEAWFGLAPPAVATPLSLACGLGTLLLLFDAARRLQVRGRALGPVVAGAVVLGCVLNRTFLTFLSSGLETAQFNLVVAWWVALLLRPAPQRSRHWLAWVALAAALGALSRPDGLLLVAATLALSVLGWVNERRAARRWQLWQLGWPLWPLLLVLAHLSWRRWFYGAWLPNTYYAKVVGAWPQSGARYLFGFVLEHGTWVWALLLLAWLPRALSRLSIRALLGEHLAASIAAATLLAHAAYYTLIIGGDHFEYRVYSQLVPWLSLSTAWLAAQLWRRRGAAVGAVAAMTLMGGFGFWHWQLTRHQGFYQFVQLAPRAPAVLRPLLRLYDRSQAWMQLRLVCIRSQQHHRFCEQQLAMYPEPMPLPADAGPLPVYCVSAVGVAGYVLRELAVIDALGLNDWVIARSPTAEIRSPLPPERLAAMHDDVDRDGNGRVDHAELTALLGLLVKPEQASYLATMLLVLHAADGEALTRAETAQVGVSLFPRHMAHERIAPEGYIQALRPNVKVVDGALSVTPRQPPLSPADVVATEAEWRARVGH